MTRAPDLDRFTSRRSTVYARRGMVATSQPLAAQAGVTALREGGNAFDAAVTTAAALNVVEPMSTGVGGDAFACYRTADGDVGALRACGGAPADATLERVSERVADREDDPGAASMPHAGPLTVTVPGTVRGWERLLDDHGRRSLAAALQPAIEYATEGFPVSEVIADMWTVGETLFTDEQARETYLRDGRAPRTGEVVTLPDLGSTLSTVAEGGADAFYEGALADRIAAAVRERGGLLAADDLAGFDPEYVDPVSTTYRGAEVYELPPNNQGLIAIEALNVAAELDAGGYDYDSADRVHYFAEALKRAFHDGHHYITDPAFEDVPDLGSRDYAATRAATVGDRAGSVSIGGPGAPPEDGDTVLLTVADEAGNVVSFINSVFSSFGSGVVVPGTGITLQNRGSSFSLDPDHPNRIEPGKRPFHTLIPGLVRFDRDDWAAFGVMGGYMQPQGHLQVLANLLDYEMPPQAALDAPRWRYLEDGSLAVEDRFPEGLLPKLARRGHDVVIQPPSEFGGGQIARLTGDVMAGATEPRKDGTVAGY